MSKLDEVADVIGHEAASELADRFGGIPLHIPQSPGRESVIVLAIGSDKAKRLGAVFGGCTIQLPSRRSKESSNRKRGIEESIRRGIAHRDIAMEHGVTLQWVLKVASRLRAQ